MSSPLEVPIVLAELLSKLALGFDESVKEVGTDFETAFRSCIIGLGDRGPFRDGGLEGIGQL